MCLGLVALLLVGGCASRSKTVTQQYTTLSNFNLFDLEHDPEIQRLKRAGWSLVSFEDSPAWAGGVDRPAGVYAVFRREVPR